MRDQPDIGVKPFYLPISDELLAPLRFRRVSIVELGVSHGDSLEMWRDAFPRATIVGADLVPPELDLGPPRADRQRRRDRRRVDGRHPRARHARRLRRDRRRRGAHRHHQRRSLQALFLRHLRPGGLYSIEDWGTGYVSGWHDGGGLTAPVGEATLDASAVPMLPDRSGPIPMPSHDLGLVELVTRLVDHTSALTFETHQPRTVADALPVQWMRVQHGVVALKRSS